MWIDHLTLAVQQIDRLDDVVSDLGLSRRDAPPLFQGTERAVIPLSDGFLELVSVVNRRSVQQYTLGRTLLRFLAAGEGFWRVVAGVSDLDRFIREREAVGARFWPPIDEKITGLADDPVPIRMTQIDPMMPWVMEYQRPRPCRVQNGVRWDAIEVQSPNPTMTAGLFRMALGYPMVTQPHGGTPLIDLENATLRFCHGKDTGLTGLRLEGNATRAVIELKNGTLSATVVRT